MCCTEVWTYRDCGCRYDHHVSCSLLSSLTLDIAEQGEEPTEIDIHCVSTGSPKRRPRRSQALRNAVSLDQLSSRKAPWRRDCTQSISHRQFLEPICDHCLIEELGLVAKKQIESGNRSPVKLDNPPRLKRARSFGGGTIIEEDEEEGSRRPMEASRFANMPGLIWESNVEISVEKEGKLFVDKEWGVSGGHATLHQTEMPETPITNAGEQAEWSHNWSTDRAVSNTSTNSSRSPSDGSVNATSIDDRRNVSTHTSATSELASLGGTPLMEKSWFDDNNSDDESGITDEQSLRTTPAWEAKAEKEQFGEQQAEQQQISEAEHMPVPVFEEKKPAEAEKVQSHHDHGGLYSIKDSSQSHHQFDSTSKVETHDRTVVKGVAKGQTHLGMLRSSENFSKTTRARERLRAVGEDERMMGPTQLRDEEWNSETPEETKFAKLAAFQTPVEEDRVRTSLNNTRINAQDTQVFTANSASTALESSPPIRGKKRVRGWAKVVVEKIGVGKALRGRRTPSILKGTSAVPVPSHMLVQQHHPQHQASVSRLLQSAPALVTDTGRTISSPGTSSCPVHGTSSAGFATPKRSQSPFHPLPQPSSAPLTPSQDYHKPLAVASFSSLRRHHSQFTSHNTAGENNNNNSSFSPSSTVSSQSSAGEQCPDAAFTAPPAWEDHLRDSLTNLVLTNQLHTPSASSTNSDDSLRSPGIGNGGVSTTPTGGRRGRYRYTTIPTLRMGYGEGPSLVVGADDVPAVVHVTDTPSPTTIRNNGSAAATSPSTSVSASAAAAAISRRAAIRRRRKTPTPAEWSSMSSSTTATTSSDMPLSLPPPPPPPPIPDAMKRQPSPFREHVRKRNHLSHLSSPMKTTPRASHASRRSSTLIPGGAAPAGSITGSSASSYSVPTTPQQRHFRRRSSRLYHHQHLHRHSNHDGAAATPPTIAMTRNCIATSPSGSGHQHPSPADTINTIVTSLRQLSPLFQSPTSGLGMDIGMGISMGTGAVDVVEERGRTRTRKRDAVVGGGGTAAEGGSAGGRLSRRIVLPSCDLGYGYGVGSVMGLGLGRSGVAAGGSDFFGDLDDVFWSGSARKWESLKLGTTERKDEDQDESQQERSGDEWEGDAEDAGDDVDDDDDSDNAADSGRAHAVGRRMRDRQRAKKVAAKGKTRARASYGGGGSGPSRTQNYV